MNAHDLAFGHGPRGCIGRHMAEMEIYKFLPTFFARLEVSEFLNIPDRTQPPKADKMYLLSHSSCTPTDLGNSDSFSCSSSLAWICI